LPTSRFRGSTALRFGASADLQIDAARQLFIERNFGDADRRGIAAAETRGRRMKQPDSEPPVADTAPTEAVLTGYDEQHLITYLRLLDAASENADWREVARIVLRIDPAREPERARHAWESHLARARWMTENGYRHLLRGGGPH
jgi:hypothetical protein